MPQCYFNVLLHLRLSIFAKEHNSIAIFFSLEKSISHCRTFFLRDYRESLGIIEVFHLLGSGVLDLSCQSDSNAAQTRWHLELNGAFSVILERNSFIITGYRHIINVITGLNDNFGVFQKSLVCFTAIDCQLWFDNNVRA